MKIVNIEKFDSTGLVKTVMVPKNQGRWRIYSHNVESNMEDIKYYEEVGKLFNIEPSDMIRVPQNHSTNIMVAKKSDGGMGVTRCELDGEYDGIITNEKGIMLLTIEADCIPVFILDKNKKAIGMIHSGWRGTVNKITQNAIDLMMENYGTNKEDVIIYMGPSICKDCYEVGMELIDEFKKILGCEEVHKVFTPIIDKPEKFLLDVAESLKLSLIKYGIKEENITKSEYCTYHEDIFYSRRLTQDKTKVTLTGIMLV